MKTNLFRSSLLRAVAIFATALSITGCLKERLAWSPDGRHAAIITADGLYLTDPTGKL